MIVAVRRFRGMYIMCPAQSLAHREISAEVCPDSGLHVRKEYSAGCGLGS